MSQFQNFVDNFIGSTTPTKLDWPSMHLTDVIDIIVVAVLIYIVVQWIKQTRAWTLFRGLLVIAVVSFLAYRFHFYTLTFIIERTFSVGVIAFIVIFQPELRKALEQIGTGKFAAGITDAFKQPGDAKLSTASVREITNACARMSASKTGALIVIENSVPTGEFTQKSGAVLDSVITEKLLINIFWKNTPLHDGAVVIRNDKVAAAACVLPATERPLGGELGTRHRAAVGASEVTDAVVVVVSEETGGISVATGGKLRRNLSANELKNILMRLTYKSESISERIKGKGRKNDTKNNGNN